MRTLITTPPGPAFDLQTLRDQVRVDAIDGSHPDDTMLLRQAAAARAFAESYTGLAIGEQTREVAADGFWDLANHTFPGGRPDSIEAFEHRTAGVPTWTALDLAAYYYDEYEGAVRIWAGAVLPYVPTVPNAVRIRYAIGSDIPPDVRAAMLLLVAELYMNRETSSQVKLEVVPVSVYALLAPHRLELGV